MSRGSQTKRAEVLGELARELRQFAGLTTSTFRAAAGRIGVAATDLQVMDILDSTDDTSAGQLAQCTGLTTGAITRILDRLEEAGLVRRERDQSDGRRVIVRLETGLEKGQEDWLKVRSFLDSAQKAWDEVVSGYDDPQITFLVEFLKRSNDMSRKELVRWQDAPPVAGVIYSAPLEELQRGRLTISCSISQLTLHADEGRAELYRAHFEGPVPNVKVKEGEVAIRYPRRRLSPGGKQGAAEIALSVAVPWGIAIQGGAADIVAELGGLDLAGLEVKGGFSKIRLDLPAPSGVVPIRIMGGAPEIILRRPANVAARVHLKGWVSNLVFDDQTFSGAGNNLRLQSSGYDPTAPGYAIEVTSYASMVTITSG